MKIRSLALLMLASIVGVSVTQAQDVNEEAERAIKEAAKLLAPSIARIETTGGTDVIGAPPPKGGPPGKEGPVIRKGVGPTTGLVVDADGYVLTSSFNFANKPTDIFVTVPGFPRAYAKVVATDETRMLTLLKVIDQKGYKVPEAFPKADLQVGQWAIAMGRSLNPNIDQPPSISIGILSAIGRVWGKAVQTDAKVSPVNYGGPLVAIDGRVIGLLIPASPQGDGETAGFEWYDSGIGFAVPFEDILRVVPKMKAGTPDKPAVLRGGLLGVNFQSADQYNAAPVIGVVNPSSPAEKAGLKTGDRILEVDGKPVFNNAQVLHVLRPKYEGDTVSLKIKRGEQELEIKDIKLSGTTQSFEPGFLGILPMRDDPEVGLEIRYVFAGSPADKAGLKIGDRILKVGLKNAPKGPMPGGLRPFSGRQQFAQIMQGFSNGTALTLEVKRAADEKVEIIDVTLSLQPDEVPAELPNAPASKGRALEPQKPVGAELPKGKEEPKKEAKKDEEKPKIKTGLIRKKNEALNRDYWVHIPDNYDPNVSHGLIVWLHAAGRDGRDADDMSKLWDRFCEKYNFIIMGPKAGSNTGWVPGEAQDIRRDMDLVFNEYTIDRQRVIIHGTGLGGQMAYYLGFNARDVFRGCVPVAASLATNPKDPQPNQTISFFIVGGAKDPTIKDIERGANLLKEKKYPVWLRIMKESGKEYVNDDDAIFREMVRWMDALDRR